MELTIKQIADIVSGKIEGNQNDKISNIYLIYDAINGGLSFLTEQKYEKHLYNTDATAVIVDKSFIPKKSFKTTLIRVDNTQVSLNTLRKFYEKLYVATKKGIEKPSHIASTAILSTHTYIGAFTYIDENVKIGINTKIFPQVYIGKNSEIGENTIVYPGVKIYDQTKIGNHCIVESGVVIGSDGFGFLQKKNNTYVSIPQTGNVTIKNNVYIGANTVIDRATIGSTTISENVELSNLIQIAHNVHIGKNTIIGAQTGISGSSTLGENCVMDNQSGLAGHLNITHRTKINFRSGLMKSIKEEQTEWMGAPAMLSKDFLRLEALFKKLPELQKRIDKLEKKNNSIYNSI